MHHSFVFHNWEKTKQKKPNPLVFIKKKLSVCLGFSCKHLKIWSRPALHFSRHQLLLRPHRNLRRKGACTGLRHGEKSDSTQKKRSWTLVDIRAGKIMAQTFVPFLMTGTSSSFICPFSSMIWNHFSRKDNHVFKSLLLTHQLPKEEQSLPQAPHVPHVHGCWRLLLFISERNPAHDKSAAATAW